MEETPAGGRPLRAARERSRPRDGARARRERRLRAEARVRALLVRDSARLASHRGGPTPVHRPDEAVDQECAVPAQPPASELAPIYQECAVPAQPPRSSGHVGVSEPLSAQLEAALSSLATLSELCDKALDRLDHHDEYLKEMHDYLTRSWWQPSQAWSQPATQWHHSEAAWQYPLASWHHQASRWPYSDEQFETAAPNEELSSSDDEPPRNFVVGTATSHALPSPPALGGPLPTLEEPEITSPHDDLSSSEDEPPRSFVAGTAPSHGLPPLPAFPLEVMTDVLSPEECHLREMHNQFSSLHQLHRRTSEQLAFTIESEEVASAIRRIQSAIHIIGRRSVSAPHELAPTTLADRLQATLSNTLADRLAEYGRVQRAIRTIEPSSHTQSVPRLEGRPD